MVKLSLAMASLMVSALAATAPDVSVAADSVLFNPRVVSGSVVLTGMEARFRFHPKQWDQALTADLDTGNVGATAEIANDLSVLLNTVYDFSLSFSAATKEFTWTIWGGPLTSPSVMTVVELDSFNALRFNARTVDPTHTMTFSDLSFGGLPGTGILRTEGTVSNAIDGQRIVAASGLLSDSDWSFSGKVSTDGTQGSKTKIWIETSNLLLKTPPPLGQ